MKTNDEKPDKSVPLLKPQYLTEGYDPEIIKTNDNPYDDEYNDIAKTESKLPYRMFSPIDKPTVDTTDEDKPCDKPCDKKKSVTNQKDNWSNRVEGMICRICIFFVPKSNHPTIGRCRYNPPTMKGFPITFSTDWCGQHRIDENKAQKLHNSIISGKYQNNRTSTT